MKKTALWLLFVVAFDLAGAADGVLKHAPPAGQLVRQPILLDASWRFHKGDVPGAEQVSPGVAVRNWQWKQVDGSVDLLKSEALSGKGGAGWADFSVGKDLFVGRVGFAWCRTTLPPVSGPVPTLSFDGVDDNATVYLNGKQLIVHEGWNDPFDVDLRSVWSKTGPNVLAVLVENTNGMGGITAPVTLKQEHDLDAKKGPAAEVFDDHAWREVHLPHDFVIEGTFSPDGDSSHGFLPKEVGWYRKSFEVPGSARGKSVWIDFEGVYRSSRVWINGHYLGMHRSGYTSFRYDVGPYLHYGTDNQLAVYVDPRQNEGWWYEGGGIYRHVWLNIADPVHVGPWGTKLTYSMPEPNDGTSSGRATLKIATDVTNDLSSGSTVTLAHQVYEVGGGVVAQAVDTFSVSGAHIANRTTTLAIDHPLLWSPDHPHLYFVLTKVLRDRKVVDDSATTFGFRTVRFDSQRGLMLNGLPLKIQGTCNHQDFAGLGTALPDNMEYWRVAKLKEMGANGWRMSHNPPTPSLLQACDELGMLVMDENRHLGDTQQVLGEVSEMVRRDRNHPSVIMWSMCNEESAAGTARGREIFKHMKETVLKDDDTRPITSAMNSGWFGEGFTGMEDLMGVNYNYEVYDQFHKLHPEIPLYGSETASTLTTRGEYADNKDKVFVSSYNMTDGSWAAAGERPFVAGTFVWTGFDYKGEPTPYVWPDVNSHFGIMDMCGLPKDNYFYYQAWWKSEPMLHIMPHWNWQGREGQAIRVVAFSNAASVELFLNGKTQGKKKMPNLGHLEWTVRYQPGALSAVGYDATGKVVSQDKVETTDEPSAITLKTDKTELTPDGESVRVIEVDVVDGKGRVVPTAGNKVHFEVVGVGHVMGVGNGNPGDHDPDKANYRTTFNGKCVVIVGGSSQVGETHVIASAVGLRSAELVLKSK